MGATPAISFQLVDATPYRLRYLCTTFGGGQLPVVLPNAGQATPDLRTDAASAAPGSGQNPMITVVSTAVVNQVEARKVLLGEQPVPGALTPAGARKLRAHCQITQRNPAAAALVNWDVDADEGANAGSAASAGFPVLVLDLSTNLEDGVTAYLDIFVADTYNR
jgi:hypothetical protein